jgi:hypothetical protein
VKVGTLTGSAGLGASVVAGAGDPKLKTIGPVAAVVVAGGPLKLNAGGVPAGFGVSEAPAGGKVKAGFAAGLGASAPVGISFNGGGWLLVEGAGKGIGAGTSNAF